MIIVLHRLIQPAEEPAKTYGGLENASKIFGEGWNDANYLPVRWVVGATVVLLGLLLCIAVFQKLQHPAKHTRPLLTFHRFARQLGLSWMDQWLLWRIAHQQHLPSPLTLILSPLTLRHHAAVFLSDLEISRPRRSAIMLRVAAMRRAMF